MWNSKKSLISRVIWVEETFLNILSSFLYYLMMKEKNSTSWLIHSQYILYISEQPDVHVFISVFPSFRIQLCKSTMFLPDMVSFDLLKMSQDRAH